MASSGDVNQGRRRIPKEPRIRGRYHGCLLGGAVGDALGAPVEFMRRTEIVRRFGVGGVRDYLLAYARVGAITDDTQMTLFTADGILRGHLASGPSRQFGSAYLERIANAYLRWLSTQGRTGLAMVRERAPGWLIGHPELFSRRAPGNTCLSALELTTARAAAA